MPPPHFFKAWFNSEDPDNQRKRQFFVQTIKKVNRQLSQVFRSRQQQAEYGGLCETLGSSTTALTKTAFRSSPPWAQTCWLVSHSSLPAGCKGLRACAPGSQEQRAGKKEAALLADGVDHLWASWPPPPRAPHREAPGRTLLALSPPACRHSLPWYQGPGTQPLSAQSEQFYGMEQNDQVIYF